MQGPCMLIINIVGTLHATYFRSRLQQRIYDVGMLHATSLHVKLCFKGLFYGIQRITFLLILSAIALNSSGVNLSLGFLKFTSSIVSIGTR